MHKHYILHFSTTLRNRVSSDRSLTYAPVVVFLHLAKLYLSFTRREQSSLSPATAIKNFFLF